MNDGIVIAELQSMDEAMQQIFRLGKGMQLVKVDLKQAYCQISVHPEHHYLLVVEKDWHMWIAPD